MSRDTTLSDLLDRYTASSTTSDEPSFREDLEYAPAALTVDEAVQCADFLRTHIDIIGSRATISLLGAITGFLRQFQAPQDEPASEAVQLAYRQWLDMEGRYLGMELFPGMGADADRLVPMNTGVDKLHHAHGTRQTLLPPPSSRAVKVLSAVGIDLAEIERRHREDMAAA